MSSQNPRVVVIGAGIGGLTTAAILARAGLTVTVLEAHIYPGGCAGTFFHQGFRFDAGATVAGGFYPGGPMDRLAGATGIDDWEATPTAAAMAVHLPDYLQVSNSGNGHLKAILHYGDERRWQERQRVFGAQSMGFWQWQEKTADLLWNLALRLPPWPPQTPNELGKLVARGAAWAASHPFQSLDPRVAMAAFQPLAPKLKDADERLRLFIDGQLLIAAQTTSYAANALYAASALDLPRRGMVHFHGGMGTIAEKLVDAIRASGGEVHFRSEVKAIRMEQGRPVSVSTKRNQEYDADIVIANLTPWNIAELLGDQAPQSIAKLPKRPDSGWGAFMLYAGIDETALDKIPQQDPRLAETLHHQIIVQEPLGEGNSVFVSISPPGDRRRAPAGKRALTISTHTGMNGWWILQRHDRKRYEQRRAAYSERIFKAVARIIPEIRAASELILPGTPVTFNRFTRRKLGWVGGVPQKSLFQAWGPRLAQNLWMVGDSIFPGQSTAAVALGGMRVADAVLSTLDSVQTRRVQDRRGQWEGNQPNGAAIGSTIQTCTSTYVLQKN